jgi:hypothetical protein
MLDRPGEDTAQAVSRLLAAASAPATGRELSGEAQALAEFRTAARLSPLTPAEGARFMSRPMRKLAAAPVLALGVAGAVLAGGGVALAASQGALHIPFSGHDNRSDNAPSAPASTNPGLTRTGAPTDASSSAPEATQTPETPGASPSPSMIGLCRAFQAGATHDGKTNPAFSALAATAGGVDNISTYCVTLIGSPAPHPAAPTHPAKPTQAANPTGPEISQPQHRQTPRH